MGIGVFTAIAADDLHPELTWYHLAVMAVAEGSRLLLVSAIVQLSPFGSQAVSAVIV